VVTKPQNVLVLKDIMANGYRAGGNTKFFMPLDEASDKRFDTCRQNIQERLNFENVDEDPASMLAFPLPVSQYHSGAMDTVMSVTTRLLPYEVNGGPNNHSSFPGGQDMFTFYESKLGLRAVHFGEDLRATENMEYMSQVGCVERRRVHVNRCGLRALTRFVSLLRTAGLDQQRALLPRPAPQVRRARRALQPAHSGHGALGPGRAAWRRAHDTELKLQRPCLVAAAPLPTHPFWCCRVCTRRRGGAGASRSTWCRRASRC
jgi:hypothetical protein